MEDFFSKLRDLLKSLIDEAVNEALSEKVPYPPTPVSINDKILTRMQAAAYLQVTPNTVTRYVRQGKLIPASINGKYRFIEMDLIIFLNKHKG